MLFKLSFQNIKKSMKDYAIYFFTLILGVAIFYIFNAIETQSAMLKISNDTREIVKLLTQIMSWVSVFIACVLGFLVIYASRFLMKRRNKEFGLYLVLGMGKRKVSLILFFETLIIGIISLVVGIIIGIGASQFTSFLVASMFQADMSKYQFVFSSQACIKTILNFVLIYVIVIIFNTFSINKCKLIDLFQGNRKNEKIKLKNPIICGIIFAISIVMLIIAYYNVTAGYSKITNGKQLAIYIVMGCVGTFLFFWSVSGLLLKVVSSMKGIYYKGLNTFTFRQMSSRVNTNVFSMTIISLMLFITICVLSSGLSIRNSLNDSLKQGVPADINFNKVVNLSKEDGYGKKEVESSNKSIFQFFEENGYNIEPYLKEYVDLYIYQSENVTLNDTLGNNDEKDDSPTMLEVPENIVKVSDYNRLARFYGKDTIELNDDEYIVLCDYSPMIKLRNKSLKAGVKINVFGNELIPKYKECQEGFIEMSGNPSNTGIIIVPDGIVDENHKIREFIAANYSMDDKKEVEKFEQKVEKIYDETRWNYMVPMVNTKNNIIDSAVGIGAIGAFIGLYIGVILLISGAAILALKELSESADNVERFRMIRKLGADEKQINKALFRQTALFFIFPLALAIVHSIFGMMFSKQILDFIGTKMIGPSIGMTAIILLVIYGGYFLISYFCSKNIIKE
ncbi:FtsX-like permease family protein [Eubacterium sp. CAG:156]|uniref:FtsX-like permease family protein n=1 Tax=Eubacterium sp. CAG:156 TaxID=1262880 RepID=UPI00034027B8|nr:efflux ABC transporter permease protein [Eubacterium sp. CAG:156]